MKLLASASWLPSYRRDYVRGDAIAGVALAGLLIPEALGYAGIAGLPPASGLYATGIGLFVYALFGTSRQLAVSPTSSSAAILAASVSVLAAGDLHKYLILTSAVTVLAGMWYLVATVLRLGFASEFVSKPVLKGFVFGIAVSIIIKQAPKLVGVEAGGGNALHELWRLVGSLADVDPWTMGTGVVALTALFAIRRFAPRIPGAVVVLAAGVVASKLLGLDERHVRLVGSIPAGLPSFTWPRVSWSEVMTLLPASVGLVLVVYAEAVGAARNFAIKNDYDIDANTDLYALGLANITTGLFGGMVVGGGTSGTAMNDGSGARTEMSAITASGVVVVTLLFLTRFFRDLPEAVLAAIVIHAVSHLIDVAELRRYARIHRAELWVSLLAIASVVVFGILNGLMVAVGVTLVLLMKHLARPHLTELGRLPGTRDFVEISRHPNAEREPGLLMVRLDGFLFFATAHYIQQELDELIDHAARPLQAVMFNMEVIPDLDITGLDALAHVHHQLAKSGIRLLLARVKDPVREQCDLSGLSQRIGPDRIFRHVDAAVESYTRTASAAAS